MKQETHSAWHVALGILTRRDHSQAELVLKLKLRGFNEDEIEPAVAKAFEYDYLNDARFAAGYVRYRSGRGMGPVRLRNELRQKQVSQVLIDQAMADSEQDWFALCLRVYQQKYRSHVSVDSKLRAKIYRFLIGRGFTNDQIKYAISIGSEP